jgi:hypothetical protein
VPGSNPDQDTDYNDWGSVVVFLSPCTQNPGGP